MNYALVVGVSQYLNLDNLDGVANDAREISQILDSNDQKSYSLTRLLNTDATKEEIEKQMKVLAGSVGAEDTVIVYFAGHGGLRGAEAFFLTSAFARDLDETGIPLSWLRDQFEELPCKRALFLLDFCHSGAAITRQGEEAISRALDLEGEGKVIISACTKAESSHEDPRSGHGWFTKAILDGLKGGAANADGWVTVDSLFDYVCVYVQSQTANTTCIQNPQIHGDRDGDIRLVYRDEISKQRSSPSTRKKPRLRRADFDQDIAAKTLFEDLYALMLEEKESLSSLGVRLVVQKDDQTEKVLSLKLPNGKQLGIAFAMGGLLGGFDQVRLRFGWNPRTFNLSGPNSANDFFTPVNVPGEQEDYVQTTIGAVVKDKRTLPKSEFLDAFWDFVCQTLEALDG